MLIGILAGLTTCALWGLTFVAPRAVVPFSAVDLTIARYVTFGFLSACLMIHPRLRPSGIGMRRTIVALLLGGCGYVGYFVAVAHAVDRAGAALPPVIIGAMPVIMALIANGRDRALPWGLLAGPLGAIAAGVLIVNVETIGTADLGRREDVFLGLLSACAALGLWVAYGLVNSVVMRSRNPPDALQWTGLQGIGAAVGSLLLLPFASFGTGFEITPVAMLNFAGWTLLMGVAGSWLATWCWAIAAYRLPVALAAQLIVAETVFGLAFGFLFERRWPATAEWTGCALQITGVAAAIAIFGRTGSANSFEG